MRPRGLILVTGPTGSGKSTTLAAMLDHINQSRKCHIMTIEDPIEFLHKDQMAIVNQREVGSDTASFAQALKRVLRQDPDVILVGELRDLETISAACTAAETGHLVLGTLHTSSAPSTVDRMIDVFPPYQQEQIRMQLTITLQGVISQSLLPKVGGGRIAAHEVMVCTIALSNLIREAKTHQMVNVIQGGSRFGMHTLDQNLAELVKSGQVLYEEALAKSQEPVGFEAQCGQFKGRGIPRRRGSYGTSMTGNCQVVRNPAAHAAQQQTLEFSHATLAHHHQVGPQIGGLVQDDLGRGPHLDPDLGFTPNSFMAASAGPRASPLDSSTYSWMTLSLRPVAMTRDWGMLMTVSRISGGALLFGQSARQAHRSECMLRTIGGDQDALEHSAPLGSLVDADEVSGGYRVRTGDLRLARAALSQLS